MTDDPERLIHSTQFTLERDMLNSLRDISPPEGALEQGWQHMVPNVALLGVASSVTESAATHGAQMTQTATQMASTHMTSTHMASTLGGTAASKLIGAKLMFGLAAGTIGVGAALFAIRSAHQDPSLLVVNTPNASVARVGAATPPVHEAAPNPSDSEPVMRLPVASDKPIPYRAPAKTNVPSDVLLRESAALVEARAKLRQGDTSGANAALRQLDADFPRGRLTQEREVLRIELLAALGNHDAAAERARAFVKRYPQSAHTAHVQRFVKSP